MASKGSLRYTLPDADGSNRRLHRFHGMHIHGCAVCAKQHGIVEIKRVLRIARRMIARHVQGFEIVVIRLDLRQVENLESHAHKDLLDFRLQPFDRVRASQSEREIPAGHVDLLLPGGQFGFLGCGEPLLKLFFNHGAQLIHRLAESGPFLFGKIAQFFQLAGDHAVFPGKVFVPNGFPRLHVRDSGQIRFEEPLQLFYRFIHHNLWISRFQFGFPFPAENPGNGKRETGNGEL